MNKQNRGAQDYIEESEEEVYIDDEADNYIEKYTNIEKYS